MKRRSFDGRTVLITGAAGGLGAALCKRFLAAGARVGALDVDEVRLQQLQRAIGLSESQFAVVAVDLSVETATVEAIRLLRQRVGEPYCVVNNAGVTHLRNFGSDQASAVSRVMSINFLGSVHTTAACMESVVRQKGLVIGLSSVAGYAPLVARTGYAASKHALEGFLKTLRCELHDTGVSVLIVRPSFIATGLRSQFEPDSEAERAHQRTGQEDSPEQVAELIVRAAQRDQRRLLTGRVGLVSYWLYRFAPRLFERLMRQRIRAEP